LKNLPRLKLLLSLAVAGLLLTGCARPQDQERIQSLEEQLNQAQQEVQRLTSQKRERIEALKQQNRKLESQLSEIQDAETRQEGQNFIISLQSRILFDLGKYQLKPESKETLKKVAEVLKKHPDRPIAVEGHTDTVPVKANSPYPSNMHLSAYRAVSVFQYLTNELGLNKARLRAVGYGANHPIRPNDSPENRRLNRRVELVLYPPKMDAKSVNPR